MRTTPMTPKLYDYVIKHCQVPHPILDKVTRETTKMPDSRMQISRDQGELLKMLAQLMGAKLAIEIGCYTGYSAISIASGLAKNGKLITLDINTHTSKLAQGFFKEAGLDHKIELKLGDGLTSLAKLEKKYGRQSVDLVFIDADKENYINYYEASIQLVRPGGLIVVDNVIWNGSVIDYSNQDQETVAIRNFNDHVQFDDRVERLMLHISDGVMLLRKKDWLE